MYKYELIYSIYCEDNSIETVATYEKTGSKRSLNGRIFKLLKLPELNTVYPFFFLMVLRIKLKQILSHPAMAQLLFQK